MRLLDAAREMSARAAAREAPAVVYVHEVPHPARPHERTDRRVDWREGLSTADLRPSGWTREHTRVAVNGLPLQVGEDVRVAAGDHVTICRMPAAPAAFAVVALAAEAFLAAVGFAAFLYAAGRVAGYLFGPDAAGREPGKNSNPVYGWGQVTTNYNPAGMPRPVQYGEHRQGGAVIQQWVDVVDGDPPQSYLNLLLLVSAGPIQSIGQYTTDQDGLTGSALPDGLRIDDNSAKNFDGITCSLRLGTLTQAAIPGASDVRSQYPVELVVDQVTIASGDTPVTDWSLAATYDMPADTEADRARIGLFFPEGLYELADSGEIFNERVDLQVRYVALDGAGNPTGPWVNAYFGNDTTVTIKGKQTNPFSRQLEVDFFDPATFTPPVLSNALTFSRSNKHYGYVLGALPLEPTWVAGAIVQAMSFAGVVQVRASHADNFWFGSYAISVAGFFVTFQQTSPGVSGVSVGWTNGTSSGVVTQVGEILDDTPTMVAVTWARGVGPGGTNRLRVAVDGQVVHEEFTAVDIKLPGTGWRWNVAPGQEAGASSFFGELDHDEFRLWNRELTPDELAELHNDGDWLSGKATDAGLVLAYHMDTVLGTTTKTTPSYLPGQPAMTLVGATGAPSAIAGFVTDTFDNTIKRGRYRVQVQRLNAVPTGLKKHSEVSFDHLVTILDDRIAYRGDALLFLRILASDQLSGGPPNVTFVAKGKRTCPVWDGVNPDAPTFVPQYTSNPAWCLADMLLDAENGGGNFFGVHDIDWVRLKEWADVCDEKVYDQRGQFTASQLAYVASAAGFPGAVLQVRLPTPRPVHLVLNKTIRLRDIPTGGAGDDYPEGVFTVAKIVDIDEDSFEVWCDWPAGTAAPGTTPFVDAAAAVVEGVEGRHECNLLLLDRDLKFWDAVAQFCALGRAAPMRVGDRLRIKYDGPRDPVALFTAANIVAGSFRLSAGRREDDANSLVAEIQDRDMDWERNPVPRNHPSVQSSTSTAVVRRKVIDLRGVTSRSQAIREMDFRLAIAHEIHLGCEFEAGLDAAFVEPGDVIAVAHPMPEWAAGGRVLENSPDASGVRVDVPLVVGATNLLGATDAMHQVASWSRVGANPPTLVSSTEPDPDGVAQAAVIQFGATDSVLRYVRALRAGQKYVASLAVKVKDGLGVAAVNVNLDSGNTATNVPDDGAWHRIEVQLEAGTADVFDVECNGRRLALAQAQLERGTVASSYTPVDTPSAATITVAVQDAERDELAFAAVPADAWGAYDAGELVPLATPLPNVPQKGWLWAIGPEASATMLFQVIDTALSMTLRRRIVAVEYDPAVYSDADEFEDLPASLGAAAGNAPTLLTVGAKAMPDLVGPVLAVEESHEDDASGALTTALAVSWRHDRSTAQHVARTHVWLQRVDAAGADSSPELVGTVQGRGTFFRVDGVSRRLTRGGTFRVFVQPETTGGVRRAVRRCRSATVAIAHYFPVPRSAPPGARVVSAGDQVVYEADLPARYAGKALEFWRGGAWLGAEVGRVPVGCRSLGPTYDWVAPPTAADGRRAAPLMVRLVGPNGARGDFLRLRADVVPAGFSDPPELAASLEDGPFNAAPAGFTAVPALSNLQLAAPAAGSSVQRLAFSGSALQGSYTTTTFDLGVARRAHVGICWEGLQVPGLAFDDLPAVDDPSMRSWTAEGYLDPNHPDFGQVKVELQWAYSTTAADPGSDWKPFRPSVAYFRSCRFRLVFTRPTADWDMRVDRIAVDIRVMRDDQGEGGGQQQAAIVFGTATDTVYTLSHGLGTRDLVWAIRQEAAPYELVDATVEATTPDTVTVRLAAAPGAGALRFVALAQPADRATVPFGDGVNTEFTVDHELGSRNLLWSLREAAAPYAFVGATVTTATRDGLTVAVASPPGDNALVLVAVGAALNKVAVVFGDASSTSFVVRHGLGSRDVVARVRDLTTYEFVDATIQATDEDTVTVSVTSPPGVNALVLVAAG